jgi:E3 ubiquitin-protein ligase UBR3
MMSDVLIPSDHGVGKSSYLVVDCSKHVMKDHCYWPLVSDLNNVLSHPPIAYKFMGDDTLLTMWFGFLKMFQGMNQNVRISGHHIEFEPRYGCQEIRLIRETFEMSPQFHVERLNLP